MTWIEIFAGGPQTDSQGRPHDGDAMIEKALAGFNFDNHRPPVVLGHPRDDSPAEGWVTELRKSWRNGRTILEAKIDQVSSKLRKLVQSGRYERRSASFYPGGDLRHVGFLGGVPPAVKGLAPARFSETEEEAIYFEFAGVQAPRPKEGKNNMSDAVNNFTQWIKDLGLKLVPASQEPAPQVPNVTQQEPPKPPASMFSEADLEKAKADAAAAAKAEAEAKIAEQEAAFAEKEAALAREKRQAEIKARVDKGVAEGLIPPALVDVGMVEFLEAIDGAGPVEFADKKTGPVDHFFGILEQAKKLNLFSEIATPGNVNPEFADSEQSRKDADAIVAAVQPPKE